MLKKYKKSLFIFRRDLRLDDNTGLAQALKLSEVVIPSFIFDPLQISNNNPYKSNNAIQFMIESLQVLDIQLQKFDSKLYLFHGSPDAVVDKIIKNEQVNAIFINKDYTRYSQQRDERIEMVCKKNKISFHDHHDLLLNEPETALKKDGKPYTIFTPFYKNASSIPVVEPIKNHFKNYFTKPIGDAVSSTIYKKILPESNPDIFVHGGLQQAQAILKHLGAYKDYPNERDYPYVEKTTGLSAHLKFGTCSVRQAYAAIKSELGVGHDLLRQLYWRDFFTHIAYNFPHVFGHAYNNKFKTLPWKNDEKMFKAWCDGNTGFPIVDAGMRQLNATGFMHNRVRMIVASFLTKDLHIDWRWGEKYFANKLVDYDPSVNNGNWQWSASTGCDAQPYFRIFNPWLQQKRFDPDCLYIKKWVPELKKFNSKDIHGLAKGGTRLSGYAVPLVDHAIESALAKKVYKYAAYKKVFSGDY